MTRPAHSPLGASGAERWMNCPGSIGLLKELNLPETDEPDYRTNGTAAHHAAEKCLNEQLDAWEIAGQEFNGVPADPEICTAVQVYLDEVRSLVTPTAKVFYEFGIDAPDFHELFYGTVDCGIVDGNTLYVRDYKHGEGIVVEVEDNPQIMYYAYGLLRHHPEVEHVNLGIVQPRAFHPEGPVRTWPCSADYIREWAENELKPAMLRTSFDADLDAGKWCRFCPAKLVCPLQQSLFGAAMTCDPKAIKGLSDDSIGLSYQYVAAVKSYLKALEEHAFARLNTGAQIAGIKLVPKKANRVWKPEAKEKFMALWPEESQHPAELKSPADMEKISPTAAKLVKEYAYTPNTGLTVALASDKRPGVRVQSTAEAFPQAAELAKEG